MQAPASDDRYRYPGVRVWAELANGLQKDERRIAGVAHGFVDVTRRPMLTIQATRPVSLVLEDGGKLQPTDANSLKPPFRVPSMAEIAAIEPSGLTAVSTFSGAGGSSLGYRMAGFRVLMANEFVEAARDTYRANAPAGTVLDGRDIRTVDPGEILEAIGLAAGDLDLLDGSPPCSSFSTAGVVSEGWGKAKKYSDRQQRTDDLFHEFARILAGLRPRCFVAENVSGLVKGTAKGYFLEILAALKAAGYRVEAKLLDAQWLGVPQARERLIFVGTRLDLELKPVFPGPLRYRYSVSDAIPWLRDPSAAPPVEPETDISRFAIGAAWDAVPLGGASSKYFSLKRPAPNRPSQSLTLAHGATSSAGVVHPLERRRFSIAELKRICAFPDDFVLTGTYAQQWERLGRAVPPVMMARIAGELRDKVLLPARQRRDVAA